MDAFSPFRAQLAITNFQDHNIESLIIIINQNSADNEDNDVKSKDTDEENKDGKICRES